VRALVFFLLALLFCFRAGSAAAAPRAVLVLRPQLTAEAVLGPRSPFAPLLPRAAIGVMNVAVRGPREPASAYLTLGAGERLAAGPLTSPARFTEEQVEGDPAAVVYARRLGPPPLFPPAAHASLPPRLLHLDWAAYLNSPDPTYTPNEQASAGRLGQALLPLGGAAWLGVDEAARTRLGALVAVDAAGAVRYGEAFRRSGVVRSAYSVSGKGQGGAALAGYAIRNTYYSLAPEHLITARVSALLRRSPLVVLDLPPAFPTRRLAALLEMLAGDPELNVLLVSPYPPPGPEGAWDRLPPILAVGPGFRPGRLTSATTHTSGLVANIDVAPTLLAALGVTRPRGMSGRVMSSSAAARERQGPEANAGAVLRFAEAATLSARAIIPVGVTIEAGAVLMLALIILSLRPSVARHSVLPRIASAGMLLVAALPVGLLLGPITAPRTALGLGLAIGGWAAAAAGTAVLASRLVASRRSARHGAASSAGTRPPPLLYLAPLTLAVVVSDLILGGTLIARSPLSGFPVSGIRFYGVGNEYLGVLVGMGIVTPLLFEQQLARYRWAQAGLFLGLLLLISSPRYGANFGGALVGAAAFIATLALATRPRRPLRAVVLAGGALVLAGVGVMVWDALRPAAERTHIGDFAQAVWSTGWSAAAPVLRRKAAMDWRILTSGFALVPIAGVAPLVGLWYRGAGRWVAALLARRPELRAAAGGALVGAWTGLFLKDSGVTPWMFIQGTLLAVFLDEHLRSLHRLD
jgi:hypothetical protein